MKTRYALILGVALSFMAVSITPQAHAKDGKKHSTTEHGKPKTDKRKGAKKAED